jgi:hypothetical protein
MVMPAEAAMGAEGEMDMGDDGSMTDDTMAGDEAMEDDHMEDDHMAHGFMVMRPPGERAELTFVVPVDASGEWEIGCFEEDGAHYDDGMRSKLIIES